MMVTDTLQQQSKILATNPNFAGAIVHREVSLKRFGGNPPRYELLWPGVGGTRLISLDHNEIWSWATVRKAMFNTWKVIVLDMKPSDWHDLLKILTANEEDIPIPGASLEAMILNMLDWWVRQRGPKDEDYSASDLDFMPLHKDGFIYFKPEAFQSRVLYSDHSPFHFQRNIVSRTRLYEILHNAGGESKPMWFPKEKRNVRLWKIPEGFNEPKPPDDGKGDPSDISGKVAEIPI
jgi:hypothetical protein